MSLIRQQCLKIWTKGPAFKSHFWLFSKQHSLWSQWTHIPHGPGALQMPLGKESIPQSPLTRDFFRPQLTSPLISPSWALVCIWISMALCPRAPGLAQMSKTTRTQSGTAFLDQGPRDAACPLAVYELGLQKPPFSGSLQGEF